jgi:hypothetical protein
MKQGDAKRAIEKSRLFHAPGPCWQSSLTSPICPALQQSLNVIFFLNHSPDQFHFAGEAYDVQGLEIDKVEAIDDRTTTASPIVYIETAESTLVENVNSTAWRRWGPADDR